MKPARILLLLLAALLVVLIASVTRNGRKAPSQPIKQDSAATVTHDPAVCGRTEDAIMNMIRAGQNRDGAAGLGLLQRNKIYEVKPGDRIDVLWTEKGIVRGTMASGAEIGEDCWIPASWVK